ncbi:MAG TPA: phenylalanine--tRNA ligase subunit alpha [Cytophagales bacterium]|nr:phenylalanine--tRNA ligase subunit alpha [Cytophagales bacterium]HAP61463.1 phenylalanine--tRNA ligase subunit alpha [Cytophagales bacterium]
MKEKIDALLGEIKAAQAETEEQLEAYRLRFIGTKNVVKDLMQGMRDVAPDLRKEMGQSLNTLKNAAQDKFQELVGDVNRQKSADESHDHVDLTLPAAGTPLGGVHPIQAMEDQIIQIFSRMGFNVSDGPEIEDDWHNFTALNFPPNHPAREMQDTFFIERNPDMVLRTHTSNTQIRVMEGQKPPIRTICPGRVYRNETITARSHCFFHQVEGLYVDKGVSFKDLKDTLYHFAREMYGKNTKVRFRPSYFPFTEPSAEMDISCFICDQKGCNVCKYTGWVEILGSGMVDPNVLEACGIDPDVYSGFAFGMGIERQAMLKYQVNDLRLFSENDVRFLKQFQSL